MDTNTATLATPTATEQTTATQAPLPLFCTWKFGKKSGKFKGSSWHLDS